MRKLHSGHKVNCQGGLLKLDASGDASEPRAFHMLCYSGRMFAYFGMKMVLDLAGLKIPKTNLPALLNHDMEKIVGTHTKFENNGKMLRSSGVISNVTEAGRNVAALSDENFPWEASVGVEIEKYTYVEPGTNLKVNGRKLNGPFVHVTSSVLRETSFTPLGRDQATSAVVLSKGAAVKQAKSIYCGIALEQPHIDPAGVLVMTCSCHGLDLNDAELDRLTATWANDVLPEPRPDQVSPGTADFFKASVSKILKKLADERLQTSAVTNQEPPMDAKLTEVVAAARTEFAAMVKKFDTLAQAPEAFLSLHLEAAGLEIPGDAELIKLTRDWPGACSILEAHAEPKRVGPSKAALEMTAPQWIKDARAEYEMVKAASPEVQAADYLFVYAKDVGQQMDEARAMTLTQDW